MIDLPRPDDYSHSGILLGPDDDPCVLCGRAVRITVGTAGIWCDPNSGRAYLPAEAKIGRREEGDTYGPWPIGADCLRRHPALRPYVVRFT